MILSFKDSRRQRRSITSKEQSRKWKITRDLERLRNKSKPLWTISTGRSRPKTMQLVVVALEISNLREP